MIKSKNRKSNKMLLFYMYFIALPSLNTCFVLVTYSVFGQASPKLSSVTEKRSLCTLFDMVIT